MFQQIISKIPVIGTILTLSNLPSEIAKGAANQTGQILAKKILEKILPNSKEAELLGKIQKDLKEFSDIMESKLTKEEKEEINKATFDNHGNFINTGTAVNFGQNNINSQTFSLGQK